MNTTSSNETASLPNLMFCLAMDGVGMLSYAFPGIGETMDIVWAPISAYIFKRTFAGKVGTIGGIINFIEEIMPGTDLIPTFTLGYLYLRFMRAKQEKKEEIKLN